MADNENLDIFLRAKNETDPAFKKAGENVKGLTSSADLLNERTKPLTQGMADLYGMVSLAGQAVEVAGRVYDAFITKTVDLAMNVEALSDLIGASAEESSKLIQTAKLLGVEYSTLTSALEVAVSKGFEPSIRGLGEIADKYIAIQDPIARSSYLMEIFGRRAGPEMEDLLNKGSAGLEEYYKKVEQIGYVMDEKAIVAAKEYQKALAELEIRQDAATAQIGQEVVPIWSDVIRVVSDSVQALEDFNIGIFQGIPPLETIADAIRTGAKAYGDLRDQALEAAGAVDTATASMINAGGQRHRYASDTQQGTGRRNLYTGEVYTPPGRAAGGPVWPGLPRPVGENGMEWFNPDRSGSISDQPAGGGGVRIDQVVIQIQSSEPRAVRREVEQALRDLQAVGRL